MEEVGDIYDLGEIPQDKAAEIMALVWQYNEAKRKEG